MITNIIKEHYNPDGYKKVIELFAGLYGCIMTDLNIVEDARETYLGAIDMIVYACGGEELKKDVLDEVRSIKRDSLKHAAIEFIRSLSAGELPIAI